MVTHIVCLDMSNIVNLIWQELRHNVGTLLHILKRTASTESSLSTMVTLNSKISQNSGFYSQYKSQYDRNRDFTMK